MDSLRKKFDPALYLVTDRSLSLGRPLSFIVGEALAGGVTMVQLREKTSSDLAFYQLALAIKSLLKNTDVPLLINDRVDIALAADADGVHLGQQDLPCEIARRLLGPKKLIGLSVESVQQALDANRLDIDYLAVSPVFGTPTKTDTAQPVGLEGLKAISAVSRFPVIAIGGMNEQTAAEAIRHGANGIAVVSAIVSSSDPKGASTRLIKIVTEACHNQAGNSAQETDFNSLNFHTA
jgi:thiamine-phosphate pyrophosphorylase